MYGRLGSCPWEYEQEKMHVQGHKQGGHYEHVAFILVTL